MNAVVYQGPFKLSVEVADYPYLEHRHEAVVRVTSTCISGNDLHVFGGHTSVEPGAVLGHESMGIIEDIGQGVTSLSPGQRVSVPSTRACGECKNCRNNDGARCLCSVISNRRFATVAYGQCARGTDEGAQAEYMNVPFADHNCLVLPDGEEHENDFALLADTFPTGYHGAEQVGVGPGDSVAVFGAGPVGLMAAYSCQLRGAAKIYVVDPVRERLDLASEHIDRLVPIDFSESSPAEQIIEQNRGGVMKAIDAVGYQALDHSGEAQPNAVLEEVIKVTRSGGRVCCLGIYTSNDPRAQDSTAGQGVMCLSFGRLFEKGLSVSTGKSSIQRYNRSLRDMIIDGQAHPSWIVTNELPLEEAAQAYGNLYEHVEGYLKVILKP